MKKPFHGLKDILLAMDQSREPEICLIVLLRLPIEIPQTLYALDTLEKSRREEQWLWVWDRFGGGHWDGLSVRHVRRLLRTITTSHSGGGEGRQITQAGAVNRRIFFAMGICPGSTLALLLGTSGVLTCMLCGGVCVCVGGGPRHLEETHVDTGRTFIQEYMNTQQRNDGKNEWFMKSIKKKYYYTFLPEGDMKGFTIQSHRLHRGRVQRSRSWSSPGSTCSGSLASASCRPASPPSHRAPPGGREEEKGERRRRERGKGRERGSKDRGEYRFK